MADATPAPTTAPSTPTGAPKDWLIPVTYIIPIVFIYTMIKKGTDSNYVWHAKNGAGAVVIAIALNILFQVLWSVLGTSLTFLYMVFNLVNLAFGILMIYGAWQAWNGKLPTLPVITMVGQKLPLEKWFKKSEAAVVSSTTTTTVATPATPATPATTTTTTTTTPAPVEPTPTPTPTPAAPVEAPKPTEPTPPTPPAQPAA